MKGEIEMFIVVSSLVFVLLITTAVVMAMRHECPLDWRDLHNMHSDIRPYMQGSSWKVANTQMSAILARADKLVDQWDSGSIISLRRQQRHQDRAEILRIANFYRSLAKEIRVHGGLRDPNQVRAKIAEVLHSLHSIA